MRGRWVCGILFALILGLGLTSCGQQNSPAAGVPVSGLYTCAALSMEDLPLDTARKWLRLLPDGTGVLFLDEGQEPGAWTLEGDAFQWSPEDPDGPSASGTWNGGALNLTIGEMAGIFVREGVTYKTEKPEVPAEPADNASGEKPEATEPASAGEGQPAEEAAAPRETDVPPVRTTCSCYDGLYYVDYDPMAFTPGQTGGADLVKEDGTILYLSRLSTKKLTADWLNSLREKESYPEYQSFKSYTEDAAGYKAKAAVYQDDKGWHAEAVIDLGEDRGREGLPMYAVYLTAAGPSESSVWTDGLKAILPTLRLGEP